jgi:recombination protein RecT
MSKAIVKQENIKKIRELIASQQQQIQMALPKHMDAERLSRIAITTIRNSPKLLDCTAVSLLGCVIKTAQLGLEPDGSDGLGRAYIIPYGKEATLQIGYRGLMELAERTGRVRFSPPRIVRQNDEFFYEYGLKEQLVHRPAMRDAGKPIYAYAIAEVDGNKVFEVMTVEEIEGIRKRSKASGSGPWVTDWDEMAKKTVFKRITKYLPKSIELADAVAIDNLGDAGKAQGFNDLVIDVDSTVEGEIQAEEAEILNRQEELISSIEEQTGGKRIN